MYHQRTNIAHTAKPTRMKPSSANCGNLRTTNYWYIVCLKNTRMRIAQCTLNNE